MRRQIFNSVFGLLDYAAYPIGMLAVAPIVLRRLGTAQYGIWTIALAAVSIGSIIASGFGDANLQQVATQRGRGRWDDLIRIVRSALGIHLILGCALTIALWFLAPLLAGRLTVADPILTKTCLYCIRIAAPLIFIRSVETVCVSTQRAFERYGTAVKISVAGRLLGLAAGALLASYSYDVSSMMTAIFVLAAMALAVQLIQLKKLLRVKSLAPAFEPTVTKDLLHFGVFTWILAATGVVFSQCDRLIGGASLGASSVVAYALCAQIAQPVYGLTAAGLHFLFPYIAVRRVNQTSSALRKTVLRAVLLNWLLVSTGAGLLFIFSRELLRLLATDALAQICAPIFPAVLASSALLALTVSGNYAMVALGRVRPVAVINIGAAVAMGFVVAWLLPGTGIWAIIGARMAFASIASLVYIPLIQMLRIGVSPSHSRAGDGQSRIKRGPRLDNLLDFVPDVSHRMAGGTASQSALGRGDCADVLGVRVEAVGMSGALAKIESGLKNRIKGYICMAGVHGIMEAQRSPAVLKAYADSWMNLPDGMPMVWVGKWQGHNSIERVTGPDLMLEIFRRRQFAQFSHFLYGGKPGIAQKLADNMSRQFPWVRIVGTHTPPFRDLTPDEERDLISTLRRLKPSIIWIGISTPRQELFMQRYLPLLETSLVFGVGAAFDYHTGRIKDCAEWVKRAGLQWLHRLIQDPRHLLWRYVRNNPAFICQIGLQVMGLRNYGVSAISSVPAHDRSIARDTAPDLSTQS
ncbi:MAG TPA: WecB/TagA/CpsF family glycosyltransferase [Terracidiphilus sp.]|jgi:exopolysaccharide biosynthesis WecB/TagA/CpsF family protein